MFNTSVFALLVYWLTVSFKILALEEFLPLCCVSDMESYIISYGRMFGKIDGYGRSL